MASGLSDPASEQPLVSANETRASETATTSTSGFQGNQALQNAFFSSSSLYPTTQTNFSSSLFYPTTQTNFSGSATNTTPAASTTPAATTSATQSEPVYTDGYDFTSKGHFNNAFAAARKAGLKTFTWNGKLYGTNLDPNYRVRWGLDKPQSTVEEEPSTVDKQPSTVDKQPSVAEAFDYKKYLSDDLDTKVPFLPGNQTQEEFYAQQSESNPYKDAWAEAAKQAGGMDKLLEMLSVWPESYRGLDARSAAILYSFRPKVNSDNVLKGYPPLFKSFTTILPAAAAIVGGSQKAITAGESLPQITAGMTNYLPVVW